MALAPHRSPPNTSQLLVASVTQPVVAYYGNNLIISDDANSLQVSMVSSSDSARYSSSLF